MAAEHQHVERARANEHYAKSMSTVDMPEAAWKVTVSFYAALHYVEAVIVRAGGASKRHEDRRSAIFLLPALKAVRTDYLALEEGARQARYNPTFDFGDNPKTQELCDLVSSIRSKLGFSSTGRQASP
jgi:hypothetical protein